MSALGDISARLVEHTHTQTHTHTHRNTHRNTHTHPNVGHARLRLQMHKAGRVGKRARGTLGQGEGGVTRDLKGGMRRGEGA